MVYNHTDGVEDPELRTKYIHFQQRNPSFAVHVVLFDGNPLSIVVWCKILTCESVDGMPVVNAQFISFNAEFIVFNPQFLIFKTQFLIIYQRVPSA